MNRLLLARRWVALTVLLLACAAPALWPRPHLPTRTADASAFLFVSPNTRDDLDVPQARRQLDSPEHAHYRRLAGDVLQKLGVRHPQVSDALGEWQGSAENSLFVTVHEPVDADTVACAAAWFGLAAKQKAVLAFHPCPCGEDVLAVIDLPGRSLRSSQELLDRHGFLERTLMARGDGWRAVVLAEGARRPELERLPGAKVYRGRVVVIGAETTEAAQQRYRAVIRARPSCEAPLAKMGR